MERHVFGEDCWVYELTGKNLSRSIMLMSRHDMVAAEGRWEHDPFGGEIIDGKLWGRRTVDTKTPLFAEFSALKELLLEGWTPSCNVFLVSSSTWRFSPECGGGGVRPPPEPQVWAMFAHLAPHCKFPMNFITRTKGSPRSGRTRPDVIDYPLGNREHRGMI